MILAAIVLFCLAAVLRLRIRGQTTALTAPKDPITQNRRLSPIVRALLFVPYRNRGLSPIGMESIRAWPLLLCF
jgi:hypothetical protein